MKRGAGPEECCSAFADGEETERGGDGGEGGELPRVPGGERCDEEQHGFIGRGMRW